MILIIRANRNVERGLEGTVKLLKKSMGWLGDYQEIQENFS